jgi:3-hexulose-6-phosphate synthase/6-phospho-3-hexuloisomerase
VAVFEIKPPIVQVAIDVLNVDDALQIAEIAVRAGVDWLEAGTPLVTFCGTSVVGALSKAFPHMPILADYKTMDGAKKYVLETKAQGGHLSTVCAQAADASIKLAVEAGRESGVAIVCDLIAAPDVAARAAEVEAMGVDSVYIHWGSDQRTLDPERDPQKDLRAVAERIKVPIGIATFSVEDGVRAVRNGVGVAVIGFPLIGLPNVEDELRRYVDEVKAAYRG